MNVLGILSSNYCQACVGHDTFKRTAQPFTPLFKIYFEIGSPVQTNYMIYIVYVLLIKVKKNIHSHTHIH